MTEPDWSMLGRRMAPRSIMASLLLGMHPPRLSSARLVRWCSVFGVSENAARVAISRMVDRGELISQDGSYELAGAVRSRQTEQDRALAEPSGDWDGTWILVLVAEPARDAAARSALRRDASRAGLAEVRTGVWGRPANVTLTGAAWSTVDAAGTRWKARPEGLDDGWVDERFALTAWSRRARSLVAHLDGSTAALVAQPASLAAAFVAGAAALQHLRRDPALPAELLPADWPGAALRASYRAYQPEFARAAAAFLRTTDR